MFVGLRRSSAYINGTGIVYWDPIPESREDDFTDGYLMPSFTVPGTAFLQNQADQTYNSSHESPVGEVINHIILTNCIVFITHLNKVFAYPFPFDKRPDSPPIELTNFHRSSPSFHIEVLEGSAENFGIISRDGTVLLGNAKLLHLFFNETLGNPDGKSESLNPPPTKSLLHPIIPSALQSASVVSLAFGLFHYHALHADGTVTSHGIERGGCRSFGLGPPILAMVRGVHYGPNSKGTMVLPSDPSSAPARDSAPKTIWFEPEKAEWLRSLHKNSAEKDRFWLGNKLNEEPPM